MTPDEARALVEEVTDGWLADPDSDVVWAGDYEGRRGVRMHQRVRDFTTVWFAVGDHTVAIEAYVLPPLRGNLTEVYRLSLVRNATGPWRVHFALDGEGSLYLRGRIPLEWLSAEGLDATLGAVFDMVEQSFRGLLAAAKRDKNR